jgi:hypothetical protein
MPARTPRTHPHPPPPPSQIESLTEAEQAAAIAAKRNKIVERHEKRFDQPDALIANETHALVEDVAAWRVQKAAELRQMPLVQDVQREGEWLIRGLETYLTKTGACQAVEAPSGRLRGEERRWC